MAVSRTTGRPDAADAGGSAQSPTAASVPLVGRVRERVNQELNARKERASEVIAGVAGTVRRVGEPLHDEALGPLGAYADEAAARLDRLAAGLRDRDVAELADEVRQFGRRHPGVFAAVGFAAGVAAARFLRSTAADRGRASRGGGVAANRPSGARPSGRTSLPSTAAAGRVAVPSGSRTMGRSERTR